MKVAFAGDWHGNFAWARGAIYHAADQGAETVIHLGDYGYDFRRTYIDAIEVALKRTGLTLQFVDGNHEDFTWLYGVPVGDDGRRRISDRVHHLPRGYRWDIDGVRLLAVGGAFSVDRRWRQLGVSWWVEEMITDDDVKRAIDGGPVDVLVSHDCPSGSWIPGLERGVYFFPADALAQAAAHRTQLRKVVDAVQPKSIWHGHYHVPYQTVTDFGYGPVNIYGLDMDGTEFDTNLAIVEIGAISDS